MGLSRNFIRKFEMHIVVIIIIFLAFCGGFLASPLTNSHVIGTIGGINDEFYDSYLAISDNRAANLNELDLFSHRKQVYFHRPKFVRNFPHPRNLETTYLVMNSMQQRDKRFIVSDRQLLCHFKICNMGRKRRYVHKIRKLSGNES